MYNIIILQPKNIWKDQLNYVLEKVPTTPKTYRWILATVKPVYYGHLGTNQKCPDYQGVLIFQVSLHEKASFGTITKCVDYAGVLILKCPV